MNDFPSYVEDGLACYYCKSANIKKRFAGGSPSSVISSIVFGVILTLRDTLLSSVFLLTFIIAGISALFLKKYRCKDCGKRFNQPSPTRQDVIQEFTVNAGKLDYRGDWDEAIVIYQKIQEMGDEQQAKVAEKHIKRINAKKTSAGGG